MAKRKRSSSDESEQWREFWNNIGGSEVDPTSLRRKQCQVTEDQSPSSRAVTQTRLQTLMKHCDATEAMIAVFRGLRDDLIRELQAGTPVEPGALVAELYRRKKLRITSRAS